MLLGNNVYQQYKDNTTALPIYDTSNASNLVTRYGDRYRAAVLYGLENMSYVEGSIDDMSRSQISPWQWLDTYYNSSYFIAPVNSRANCFDPMLNALRALDFLPEALDNKPETYGPYIINRVGRCVTITHAPDLNIYSKIDFGDGTGQKVIFTDPESHDFRECLIKDCWCGHQSLGNYGEHTSRPSWGDSYATNKDPYLAIMRDYRGVHRYANNGTYTITIESYCIHDTNGSDSGANIVHTTYSFDITVGDAEDQEIIYFKIPKEFDHIYINGVRCPLVERADDYNVVGLDVTGYKGLLGKVCAGRCDVIMCALPLINTTNYVKYQCRLNLTRNNWDSRMSRVIATDTADTIFDMSFDPRTQLYYVDNLADKLNIPDFSCLYFYDENNNRCLYTTDCYINAYGVSPDNSTTKIREWVFSPAAGRIYAPSDSEGVPIPSSYYGWQPFFTRSSIQVAEFENDYVRITKDNLPYVRESRYQAKFMSDYTSMTSIPSVFGDDAVTPVNSNFSPKYYSTYRTNYDPTDGTPGIEAVVVLTEACIGKTYDLRNALPWKAFFPSCYCVDAPLNIYD
jgi:hypothetical protein